MRVDYVKAVDVELERDPRNMFITGDLGYAALEGLKTKYGRRFLNAAVPLSMASCTSLAPTVPTRPGAGRSFIVLLPSPPLLWDIFSK